MHAQMLSVDNATASEISPTSELSLQMRADKSSRMNAEMLSVDNATASEMSLTSFIVFDNCPDKYSTFAVKNAEVAFI